MMNTNDDKVKVKDRRLPVTATCMFLPNPKIYCHTTAQPWALKVQSVAAEVCSSICNCRKQFKEVDQDQA